MAAAAVATVANTEMYVTHASIQLKLPQQVVAPPSTRVYEWHTQVTGQQEQQQEVKETPVECIKQNGSSTATAATTIKATPTYYTPPRIQGNEAKRKNLPQTLGNFFEAERHASAWNRVTK